MSNFPRKSQNSPKVHKFPHKIQEIPEMSLRFENALFSILRKFEIPKIHRSKENNEKQSNSCDIDLSLTSHQVSDYFLRTVSTLV